MKKRTLFFVNIIAPYNIPLFNKVDELLDTDVLFFFDQMLEVNRKWLVKSDAIRFKYYVERSLNVKLSSKAVNDTSLLRTIYFPLSVFKRIWKQKPSTVVSIEFGLRTIFCLVMCKITGSRIIVMSDVTNTTEANVGWLKKIIRKSIAWMSDGAIARSYKAKQYLETLGFLDKDIVVAPYATESPKVDRELLSQEMDSLIGRIKEVVQGKFCFIYSGHFTHSKGLDILYEVVDALPSQIRERMIFVLAGGSEPDLRKVTPEFDPSIFVPIGFIPNSQLSLLYQEADCFLLPTRSDTWAMVVNEAVTAGCPVMVSKYAGAADEFIEDGRTGVVFDPLNKVEFTDKLIYCINNKEKLHSYSLKAKEKLKEYNNNISAERIANYIKAINSNRT